MHENGKESEEGSRNKEGILFVERVNDDLKNKGNNNIINDYTTNSEGSVLTDRQRKRKRMKSSNKERRARDMTVNSE